MVDVIQSWLESGQYAVLDGITLTPLRVDEMSPLALTSRGDQASVYHLVDDYDTGWVLKKFFPETEPDSAYVDSIQRLIPGKPGFESGFERRVLTGASVSASAYAAADFQAWVEGAILMPRVMCLSWAELCASVRAGAVVLSRVERLLLCQKVSEMVGSLELAGLAHRDLSASNVMMDTLNIEVHLIDWDTLYHASLEMPFNTTGGTPGYIAPFVEADGVGEPASTWLPNSDRFALTVLNAELLCAARAVGGGLSGQKDAQDQDRLGGFTVLRDRLRGSMPAAIAFLDAALNSQSFADCPSPSEWIELAEAELASSGQSTWEEAGTPDVEEESLYAADYKPHFVEVNESAFVRVKESAFVHAPAARWR
jgi:hypothetical protein